MISSARSQAIVLIVVVVPILSFGLGVLGFYLGKAIGGGDATVWIMALVFTTVGLVLSMIVTLRVGKSYEKRGVPTSPDQSPSSGR